MLGAIIGDLAAWTYDNDRNAFFTTLLSKDAVLSDYGNAALSAALSICEDETRIVPYHCTSSLYEDVGPLLIQSIEYAWCDEPIERCIAKAIEIEQHYAEKAGMYFLNIAVDGIYRLRHGATKSDISQENGCFCFKSIKDFGKIPKQAHYECLAYLAWAKECLDESWDFTSAIHQASYKEGDKHFLLSLVGALAEAMYGCKYRLLKKEYTDSPFMDMPIPVSLQERVHVIREYNWKHRHFFPKNNAMTNSERIKWMPVESRYENQIISKAFATGIKKAFYTNWENRYGFYLENGWEYVYRSGFLLARFRIIESGYDTCRLVNIQSYDESRVDADTAISEALSSVAAREEY